MAGKTGTGMKQKSDRKTRGRASIASIKGKRARGSTLDKPVFNVPQVLKTEASRPVSAGVKHRGDRRDTSKAYTGNTRHASRGNNPRIDVKTRAR